MLRLALFFLIVGLVAGALGFSGIEFAAIGIARFLFGVFMVIFLVLILLILFSGSGSPPKV